MVTLAMGSLLTFDERDPARRASNEAKYRERNAPAP
jgi:hypothetical protein